MARLFAKISQVRGPLRLGSADPSESKTSLFPCQISVSRCNLRPSIASHEKMFFTVSSFRKPSIPKRPKSSSVVSRSGFRKDLVKDFDKGLEFDAVAQRGRAEFQARDRIFTRLLPQAGDRRQRHSVYVITGDQEATN